MTANDIMEAIEAFKKEQDEMRADLQRLEQKIDTLMILLEGQDKVKSNMVVAETEEVQIVEGKSVEKEEVQKVEEKSAEKEEDLYKIVTDYIHKMGIPAHIKGYEYIRDAIIMVVQDPSTIQCITKIIYPEIAKKYIKKEELSIEKKAARVERGIRSVIEIAFSRGNLEFLNEIFGCSIDPNKGKPTNSKFIATIADKIRMEIK